MNEQTIWNYLIGKLGNSIGVAALMGNLRDESNLNPQNLQNSFEKKLGYNDQTYTQAVDSGAYKNFTNDGAGYGIVQWTFWSRKVNLHNFAKDARKSIGDLGMQLDFMRKELQGNKEVLKALQDAKNIREASDTVLFKYERPADQGEKVQIRRAAYGQEYYERFAEVKTMGTLKIVDSMLIKNPCYKANVNKADDRYTTFQKRGPIGGMLHSVGCSQPSAEAFVKNWNNESYDRACVHGFIDANTGVVHQCLPWNFRGWHGGGSSNNTHFGVEMCEPDGIKYTSDSSFQIINKEKAIEQTKRTYEAAVLLFAKVFKEYGLDPMKGGVLVSHKEGCARGIASNHGDPEHLWKGLGLSYTMDTFRKDVKAAMGGSTPAVEPEQSKTDVLYHVQVGTYSKKANADTMLEKIKKAGFDAFVTKVDNLYKVQLGAYSKKANADAMLEKVKKAGYEAFITTKSGAAVSSTPAKKPVDEIAKEVINGNWGNGEDRKKRLEAAGYNYSEVQKRVNKLCR